MASVKYDRVYLLELETDDGELLLIDNLQIRFEVEKSLLGYPNLARIQVFNLSADTSNRLTETGKMVYLTAGYVGTEKLIFKGRTRNILNLREGVNKYLEIYASDGQHELNTTVVSESRSKGSTVSDIVTKIAQSLSQNGISTGLLSGLDSAPGGLTATAYSGTANDVLNRLSREGDFQWSINDGVFTTVGINESDNSVPAFLVNQDSGMLGSPTLTEIGVDVALLMEPDIVPNRLIKIEAANPQVNLGNLYYRTIDRDLGEGVYKVVKVTHTGDYRGTDWKSTVVGQRLTR